MATRRRRNRPPARRIRQQQTQTKRRDLLVERVEREYVKIVRAHRIAAEGVIEEWIDLNARETSNDSLIIIDEGERRLIAALRRIFNNTRSLTRLFGRMASNISQDVDSTIVETIPVVARSDLVASPLVNQYARRNAELVKNLTVSEIDRFTKIIRTGEGRSAAALKNEFQRAFSVTESKAKLWARDQTLKLHSNITKERHQAVGIQRYFWTDSNDERVRAIHDELGDRSDEGETFSYRNPPVTSEDGRRNNPGEDYNCRCTAYPVL